MSIKNEAKDITLIIVAHKLSTLETCNKILRVKNQTVTVERKGITNYGKQGLNESTKSILYGKNESTDSNE